MFEICYQTSVIYKINFSQNSLKSDLSDNYTGYTVILARGQKLRTALSLVRVERDRPLKLCEKDNLFTNESELRDNPLSVRIGHPTYYLGKYIWN